MKKTGMIMRINMRKVERMTQRKRMSLTKVLKMIMVWKLLKRATSSSYCKKCEVNFKNKKSSEDI